MRGSLIILESDEDREDGLGRTAIRIHTQIFISISLTHTDGQASSKSKKMALERVM